MKSKLLKVKCVNDLLCKAGFEVEKSSLAELKNLPYRKRKLSAKEKEQVYYIENFCVVYYYGGHMIKLRVIHKNKEWFFVENSIICSCGSQSNKDILSSIISDCAA